LEGIGARTVSVSAVELEEDERFEGSPPTAKNVFNAFSKFQLLCLRNCRLMELSAPVNDMKFPIFSDCASEPPFAKPDITHVVSTSQRKQIPKKSGKRRRDNKDGLSNTFSLA
jgi:hypothetical protein